jgi:hypothetical protein
MKEKKTTAAIEHSSKNIFIQSKHLKISHNSEHKDLAKLQKDFIRTLKL